MTATGAASGRPLLALAVLGLALPLWIAVRAPELAQRFDVTLARMTAPVRSMPTVDSRVTTTYEPGRDVAPATAPKGIAPTIVAMRPQLAIPPSPVAAPAAIAASAGVAAPAAPPRPGVPEPLATSAFDRATLAYAQLAAGNRRGADRLFGEAIGMAAPDDVLVGDWRRVRQRLNRRWSGDAYTLFRDSGGTAPAASPVLGSGQSGGSIAYAFDPLAQRPLAVIGRVYAAHDSRGRIDGKTAQAAIGVRWLPAAGVSIAAERLVAIGSTTASDWNLRLAGGGERRRGRMTLAGYGEAGVRGNGDSYAGGQASAMVEFAGAQRVAFSAGPGVWGSVQQAQTRVSRLDIGVGLSARLPLGAAVSADWRWRIAGNAAPVSGPAVTASVAF